MLALLVLLFIVVPIAEIYVIIQVGEAIGAIWTIVLLIADSVVGSMLMRSQGRAAWRRFQAALAERRPPAREVLDGALVIFGGALLLAPGFITDVFGAALLLPPTRAAVRMTLARRLGGRMLAGAAGAAGAARAAARRRRGRRPGAGSARPYDVDGTAVDLETDRRRLP